MSQRLRDAAGLLGDLGRIILLAWAVPVVILAIIAPIGFAVGAIVAVLHRL